MSDVHPERGFTVLAGDDGRRQRAGPMLALVRSQRGRSLVLGARLHPERREPGSGAGQSTSRLNRSSHVSRRTTKRALPSRAKITGTRLAPLYWLDIV